MLKAIIAITMMVFSLGETEKAYHDFLGYEVVEKGVVSDALALSWGTPKATGKPYLIMAPPAGKQVYLRFIETTPVEGYVPLTSHGWTATELLVEDVDALGERLAQSPFTIIGGPKDLFPGSPVRAMQVLGPSGEILYLTEVRTEEARARLGRAEAFVGRTFIVTVAGAEMAALGAHYGDVLGNTVRPFGSIPVGVFARAMDLPPDTLFPLSTVQLQGQFLVELDDFPPQAGDRPQRDGELPPGMAIVSFEVESLEALGQPFLAEPQLLSEAPYDGRRAATAIGATGELIEFVESNLD